MAFDMPGTAALEHHEALVWSALVEATANADNNPLSAAVDHSGAISLPVVAAINSARINRVILPGAVQGKIGPELDRLCAFYAHRAQTHFAVELHPSMVTPNLTNELSNKGLIDNGTRVAKSVRQTDTVGHDSAYSELELNRQDRGAWITVTRAAWGVPRFMSPWFGAPFDVPDFHQYGLMNGDELVAVGAIHVAGELAWLGLGATHPDHRGRGLQLALLGVRVRMAAEYNCRWVHSETILERGESTNTSLRNMLRSEFIHLYDRIIFESADTTFIDPLSAV